MNRLQIIGLCFLFITACQPKTQTSVQKDEKAIEAVNKGDVKYDDYLLDKTMRVDYFHSGNASEEHFAIDRIVSDGKWAGSKRNLIDKLEMGLYFFEVLDKDTKILLYSRGFASIFGEWQETADSKKLWGTYNESLRFPWPKKPVTIILQKRDEQNKFKTIWTSEIDPASRQVNPTDITPTHKHDIIADNGDPSEKLDIVILGDGYTKTEMTKFNNDVKRLTGALMLAEPFKTHNNDINIRAIETSSETSGVNKPHPGVFKRTPLSVSYGSFDSERYILGFDNRTIRDVASEVPYDFMVIIVNERTYGGGGIYNLYTTVSADNKYSEYIMVHELGHHMAALADEYYTSSIAYERQEIKTEPWEKNVTALLDKNNLKWKDLVEKGTPIPTLWDKANFDKFGYKIQKTRDSLRKAKVPEEVMEKLFTYQHDKEDAFFAKEKYKDMVGAFEGANYLENGLYRPQVDCIMYTRHMKFCKVCNHTLEQVIKEYSK